MKELMMMLCCRMFVLQQIVNTNLVMLVVQADCDCSRQYSPITLTPREVKYILLQLFITARVLSYRITIKLDSAPCVKYFEKLRFCVHCV